MKTLVLDCSVVFGLYFADEQTHYCHAVKIFAANGGTLLVPSLFLQEMTNVLIVNERKKRWVQTQIQGFLSVIQQLPIKVAESSLLIKTADLYQLARQNSLTAYDATYLELAITQKVLLATQDNALRHAATAHHLFFNPTHA